MKWKLAIGTVALSVMLPLAACGNNDNTNDGTTNDNTPNTENTGFHDNGVTRDNLTNNPNVNHRNGTMNDNRINNNVDHHQYSVSKEAADKITNELPDIHHAYVLTTNHNAYVAADMGENNVTNNNTDNGNKLTKDMKRKIKDVVKSTDNNIHHVYVSTNPDFVDLTNNYITDTNNGKPVRGFFDQMGNMVKRLFPHNER